MTQENFEFKAEVSRLLDIVANSLYSEKEIFLRELISNASDACDKLRYLALTNPKLLDSGHDFKITLAPNPKKNTLTITDTGIGMNQQDLIDNLGTIAKSGTSEFLSKLSGDAKRDSNLIGQFGVGFYSAYMVSDKIEVHTRKAGESKGYLWVSDGKGQFTISEKPKDQVGTEITLYLKGDQGEFAEQTRLEHIVKKYSDHITVPISFADAKENAAINQANALWCKPKAEIKEAEYNDFYRHISHHFDDPWQTFHWQAEGVIDYTALLYIPSQKPFDLFQADRKHNLKLYVKKIFISDDIQELLPAYLRFIKGVIDSKDLPLNISREMLQHNPILTKIKSGLISKVLGELKKLAQDEKSKEAYLKFWSNFGPVLKEGLYEDHGNRDKILPLIKFYSLKNPTTPISLEDYVNAMKADQKAIYYISGENKESLMKSPHLEGFKANDFDVLFMTDPVDEFWIPHVDQFKEKSFKSVTRAANDLENKQDTKAEDKKDDSSTSEISKLIAQMKVALKDQVKDIKSSSRLTSSLSCLVADEGDMDIHLEKLLKQHQKMDIASKRILEINPKHPVIKAMLKKLDDKAATQQIEDFSWLMLDQARIIEGEPVIDPTEFSRRMANLMETTLTKSHF